MGKKDKQEPPLPTVDDHPLVTHLGLKPETHSHLVTLTGYPAASDDDDYFRLYLDRHFQSHYEIPRKHFVKQWKSDPDDDKAPHHVAIKGEATPRLVVHVHKRVSSSAAALLQGPIVSAHLASALDSGMIWRPTDPTQPPPPPPHGRMGTLRYDPEGDDPVE